MNIRSAPEEGRWPRQTTDRVPQTDLSHDDFSPFRRRGTPTCRPSASARFGLPLARNILHRHGGDISLASRPGADTTVTLTLPLVGKEK